MPSSSSHSSTGTSNASMSRTCSLSASTFQLSGYEPAGQAVGDQRIDRVVAHFDDDIVDGLGIHDVRALLVDHLALIVHHVVVFDDLLAHVVIARLDLLLRCLDRLRQPFRTDRLAIGEVAVHHPREQRVGAEDAQQVVLEAQVELRQPGIALAPRAAAQLVVDAPALVAFGADHAQPAGLEHFVLLGFGDLGLDPRDRGVALGALGGRRRPRPRCGNRHCRRAGCRCRARPCWWRSSPRRAGPPGQRYAPPFRGTGR